MNRLGDETSPYLRQHAQNPVAWYPWGAEALAAARAADRPIFLSIGYASCHWCHVMAHESFEDADIAAQLNAGFVSVKVDREERPDLDAVYMAATQALTGSGGWPMSVFCLPDGRPFYAGTYFPPADRHGLAGFPRVLAAMADAYANHRAEVEEQSAQLLDAVAREVRLTETLRTRLGPAADDEGAPTPYRALVEAVTDGLAGSFDEEWGGFGSAPKFPRPVLVELCLLRARVDDDKGTRAATMARRTLDAMAAGGLYDHIVGGLCRYSTDRRWLVPHFEKMLPDQALLARAYLHAWQEGGSADDQLVFTETLDAALEDLGAPGGGLYSSRDADAAGREGSHATFSPAEVRRAIDEAGLADPAGLAEATCAWFGVREAGNWEGTSVVHRPLGAGLVRPPQIEAARAALAEFRARRPAPALDDKVLTEWNAMFASVLAEAAAATGHRRWAQRTVDIAEFCFAELRRPGDGRWLRSWQDGRGARQAAFAGDYAWLVECGTRLAELTGEQRWLARAAEVADAMLDLFFDPEHGGLFTTGRDAEALVVRPKDVTDGALPAANSVAAAALFRLGSLTAQARYEQAAVSLLAVAEPLLAGHAGAVPDLVMAAGRRDEAVEVVVTGSRPDLVAEASKRWLPTAVVAWGEPGASQLWAGRREATASVCRRFVCLAPTTEAGTLAAQLDEVRQGR